jgi:hypothetical protein
MLARAGLCDDAALLHSSGQEQLTERIIYFMGPRMK